MDERKKLFPSSFEKGDDIIHPAYGHGVIRKVIRLEDRSTLMVRFEGKDEDFQMSEKWVKTHCKYDNKNDSALNEKYIITDLGINNEKAERFVCFQNKHFPVSEEAKEKIRMLTSVFDDEVCFVVIGESTFIVLFDREFSSVYKIERLAKKTMNEVLGSHPDFETSTCSNDDGETYSLVVMKQRAVYIAPQNPGHEKVEFGEALIFREHILQDCESGSIRGFLMARRYAQKLMQKE